MVFCRMVCNFIGPVSPSRAVDSPRFAARFVSLLPFHHRSDLLGGLSNENFQSPFVTCMCKQGDVVAHALLLCSLLLGQGCPITHKCNSIIVSLSHTISIALYLSIRTTCLCTYHIYLHTYSYLHTYIPYHYCIQYIHIASNE